MNVLRIWGKWLVGLFNIILRLFGASPDPEPAPDSDHARAIDYIERSFGIRIVEHDPKDNARRWQPAELELITQTLTLLGPEFFEPFRRGPLHLWIDRNPGGGHFGNDWLRIGDPQDDISVLYRVFLHEGTHASNEYRGWPYESAFCMKPGMDWQHDGDGWTHPRQQGAPPQPGEWETLPVDARDVSTAPSEDLAEMVRYFVHSVRNERAWLWPLDQSKPAVYLWDTSPTRFIYVRDHFLRLPADHPWYKQLDPDIETQVAANLNS